MNQLGNKEQRADRNKQEDETVERSAGGGTRQRLKEVSYSIEKSISSTGSPSLPSTVIMPQLQTQEQ